jgi:hypothetical protein
MMCDPMMKRMVNVKKALAVSRYALLDLRAGLSSPHRV